MITMEKNVASMRKDMNYISDSVRNKDDKS